jgi:hypothetical protein
MRGTITPTGTSDGCAVQIKYTNCSYECIMNGYFAIFQQQQQQHMSNKLLPVEVGGVLHNG